MAGRRERHAAATKQVSNQRHLLPAVKRLGLGRRRSATPNRRTEQHAFHLQRCVVARRSLAAFFAQRLRSTPPFAR
eukprot:12172365-Alexandrium_andersonii.AAC.1